MSTFKLLVSVKNHLEFGPHNGKRPNPKITLSLALVMPRADLLSQLGLAVYAA